MKNKLSRWQKDFIARLLKMKNPKVINTRQGLRIVDFETYFNAPRKGEV